MAPLARLRFSENGGKETRPVALAVLEVGDGRDRDVTTSASALSISANEPLGVPCAEKRPPSAISPNASPPIVPPTPSSTTLGRLPPPASRTASIQSGSP